jgi:FAD dependent oxidoreductase TIGR03364
MQTGVAVIGGGIVGLSQALAAARAGLQVTVFERSPKAQGASVRNFGMIWPIGVPAGPLHDAALLTRKMLIELAPLAGFWLNPCGSMHLIRAEDEAAVLEEYLATPEGKSAGCEILTPKQVITKSPAARREGLHAGLWSPIEMAVDAREVMAALSNYLRQQLNVKFEFGTTVVGIDSPMLHTADGRRWKFDEAVICGGADFQTLFPQVFAESGVRRCKLQMMRTYPQPDGWRMGPHIAGGASLRHYASFAACPSLERLRSRIAHEFPELDRYGIHILAAQNGLGEVVIGDSHEYDQDITPFDKPEIDAVILQHIGRMLDLPEMRIKERWHGIYPRHRAIAQFTNSPQPNVRIVLNANGMGMTLSLGLAALSRAESMLTVPSAGNSGEG